MVDIVCYKCKHKIHIEDDDLIKCGRAQLKQEILKLMEKQQNA